MPDTLLRLAVLLPFRVLVDEPRVTRLVAETESGSFGFLPNRLDCVAALTPGILTYETADAGEAFVAVDEGTLVKAGRDVRVAVRRAQVGTDLDALRAAVEADFTQQTEREHETREVMAGLEAGFLRQMERLHRD